MVRPLDVDMRLHALGHLDTQEREASGDRTSDDLGECEAEGTQLFILLLEDGEFVVELIVLLHKVIDIVRDDSRAIRASCFLYDICIFGDLSDELLLLGGDGKPSEGSGESDTQLLCFTKEAANTSVGVLDKGACVPVEVNTFKKFLRG